MEKVIISDLTLSTLLKEKTTKEEGHGVEQVVKHSRYWENRMTPPEKIDCLAKNFNKFLVYNPEYIQEGLIQIAVSATKDTGAYRIGVTEYIEDILVSKNPMRGSRFFVATLDEAINCASAHRRCNRCLLSCTYYMSKDKNGDIHLEKLFDNDDWLYVDRIEHAFKVYVAKQKGTSLEASNWQKITLNGNKDIARVSYYVAANKEKRCLFCLPNSGTIIDEKPEELNLGKVIELNGSYVSFSNQLLHFKISGENVIARISSNNPAFNHSLY